jgi:GAF domain-containing protein
MIKRIRQRLFTINYDYTDPLDRYRATGLVTLNWAILLVWFLAVAFLGLPTFSQTKAPNFVIWAPLVVLPILAVLTFYFVQRGWLRAGIWTFVAMLTFGVVVPMLYNFTGAIPVLLVLPLIAVGVTLKRRDTLIMAGVLIVAGLIRLVAQNLTTDAITYRANQVGGLDFTYIVTAVVIGMIFLYVFNGKYEDVAEGAQEDIRQLQFVAKFVSLVAGLDNETLILARAIDILRRDLRYTFAQIYLLDEEGNLTRRMRGGLSQQETGASIQLRLGEASHISETARLKRSLVTTPEDPVERRAHLLPPANWGISLPLVFEQVVIGVLDVQSQREVPFTAHETTALELLNSELTSIVMQARLVSDLQRTLSEQEQMTARYQSQIADLQRRSQPSVEGDWSTYLRGRGQAAFGFNLESQTGSAPALLPASDLPDHLRPTLEKGIPAIEANEVEQTISVPIVFRGETLGAMSFVLPKDRKVTDRQVEMAQVVSNRLALALENTRLFEQSQSQALRERKASEVANRLIGATDVRSVLNLAAESFNEALGAIHTRVYLQPDFLAEPQARSDGNQ